VQICGLVWGGGRWFLRLFFECLILKRRICFVDFVSISLFVFVLFLSSVDSRCSLCSEGGLLSGDGPVCQGCPFVARGSPLPSLSLVGVLSRSLF
jgi:hypothetical protein